eukprot:COSAG06_NODE_44309_length_364_cov_1.203774_1_plen_61_part_10
MLSLCLSRVCLGKDSVFTIKWQRFYYKKAPAVYFRSVRTISWTAPTSSVEYVDMRFLDEER